MSIIYANYLKRLPGSFFPRGIGFLSYEPIENPLQKIEETALEESQYYPLPKMREIQLSVAKKLVKYAYKNVPFWKRLFDEAGIKPADVKSWSDFEKISITNKAILKTAGYGKYLASNQPKGDFIMDTTSGSTGEPFRSFIDRHAMIRRIAVYKRLVKRAGLTPQKTLFRFMKRNRPGLYSYGKQIALLSPEEIERNRFQIYEELNQNESVMEATASKLLLLAQLMKRDSIEIPNLKGALPVSEGLSREERNFIESVIKCPTFNLYAAREIGFLGAECEFKTGLHINSEAMYLETVDKNGRRLPLGERGRIVVTVFDNLVMPLIRYDTGDFGILSKEKCPCGRTLPLLSLEGRPIEYIDLPDNKKVHVFELFSILYQYEAIKMFQIIQDSLYKIRVLIVPAEKWDKDLALKIKSFFYAHLPGIKKVDVDMVPAIYADPEKKRKILIKNI